MSAGRGLVFAALIALSACGAPAAEPSVPEAPTASTAEAPAAATDPAPAPTPAPAVTDDALGGRLYDRWYTGKDFAPDNAKTADAIDGRGGPFGNGSLARGDGAPWSNASGHDYRLKNLFGWDLRGSEGIAGPKYQNKKQVLAKNLLSGKESFDELLAWLDKGSPETPAFGPVLSQDELRSLTAFIVGVRDGKLPHPDQIWTLSASTPGNYTLKSGGDATRGAQIIKERCVRCHGADGTAMLFDDDEYSLGTHSRQKAYEDWAKILNGQPGTKMGRQVKGATAQEMAQEILDIFAALCDRKAFPKGSAKGADVADKDPRCGAYLR
ncbi:hypothetical protein [Chondromyces crocatus]|uniref:Cytochrome c domain-containing protein n=1 Tax=Chondromyces crocatus TaxID=52 RepID=A0A0K1ESQ2_CHOCO|nr:hypothetical protein [Chondromyces crocatus]AKT43829.1 uncharacterized protein CMC5_080660 [Chondromyces crocatus]